MYNLLYYAPFWTIPIILISGFSGFRAFQQSKKDLAWIFIVCGIFALLVLLYYFAAGGADGIARSTTE